MEIKFVVTFNEIKVEDTNEIEKFMKQFCAKKRLNCVMTSSKIKNEGIKKESEAQPG